MISPKLKDAYNRLSADNKMNKLNYELLVIEELLKNMEAKFGVPQNFKFKNYELNSEMKHEEFLEFIYDDIFEIEKQLLFITEKINPK